MTDSIQLNEKGQLQHFLSIEDLPTQILIDILDRAKSFVDPETLHAKKVPLLKGIMVAPLFFENSTRTLLTFEIAAKRLSSDWVNLNLDTSSKNKGESDVDTMNNLQAMGCSIFIVRHKSYAAPIELAKSLQEGSIINAGDSNRAHPTQAMLDMFTIREHKGDISQLSVAIIGDIEHSRVARSQVAALKKLGCADIRLIAPESLLPTQFANDNTVQTFASVEQGIEQADVVITLRIQKERITKTNIISEQDYIRDYCLTSERLKSAKSDAIVMHPGPINRGIEITSEVADGEQSVILEQVTNGIAIRMAVLSMVASSQI